MPSSTWRAFLLWRAVFSERGAGERPLRGEGIPPLWQPCGALGPGERSPGQAFLLAQWLLHLPSFCLLICESRATAPAHQRLKAKVECCYPSVAQWCPTLCDPMDRSTLGFPVLYHLLEFTQTPVHWVGDAIQPSHPLSSLSPPTLNLSHHQGRFHWVSSLQQVANALEFQLQHHSF